VSRGVTVGVMDNRADFGGPMGPLKVLYRVTFDLMEHISSGDRDRRAKTSRSLFGMVGKLSAAVLDAIQLVALASMLHMGTLSSPWGASVSWLDGWFLPVIGIEHSSYVLLYVRSHFCALLSDLRFVSPGSRLWPQSLPC